VDEKALQTWHRATDRGMCKRMLDGISGVKKTLQKLGRAAGEKTNPGQSDPLSDRPRRRGAGPTVPPPAPGFFTTQQQLEKQRGGHQGSRDRGRNNVDLQAALSGLHTSSGVRPAFDQQRQRPATALYHPPTGPIRELETALRRDKNVHMRRTVGSHSGNNVVMEPANQRSNQRGNKRNRRNGRSNHNNNGGGGRQDTASDVGPYP
jgi:hypothetical protein